MIQQTDFERSLKSAHLKTVFFHNNHWICRRNFVYLYTKQVAIEAIGIGFRL